MNNWKTAVYILVSLVWLFNFASASGWEPDDPIRMTGISPASGMSHYQTESFSITVEFQDKDLWVNSRSYLQQFDAIDLGTTVNHRFEAKVVGSNYNNTFPMGSDQVTGVYAGDGRYRFTLSLQNNEYQILPVGQYSVYFKVYDVPELAQVQETKDTESPSDPDGAYTFTILPAPTPIPTPNIFILAPDDDRYNHPLQRWAEVIDTCNSTGTYYGTKWAFEVRNFGPGADSWPDEQDVAEVSREWSCTGGQIPALLVGCQQPGGNGEYLFRSPGDYTISVVITFSYLDTSQSPPVTAYTQRTVALTHFTIYEAKITQIMQGDTRVDNAPDGLINPLPYNHNTPWNDTFKVTVKLDPQPLMWGYNEYAVAFDLRLFDVDYPQYDTGNPGGGDDNSEPPPYNDADSDHDGEYEPNRADPNPYPANGEFWDGEGEDNSGMRSSDVYRFQLPRVQTEKEFVIPIPRGEGDNFVIAVAGYDGSGAESNLDSPYLNPLNNLFGGGTETYAEDVSREFTIIAPIDMDVDSDNTQLLPDFPPDEIAEEDAIEENPAGRLVFPNDDDDDQDGIADWLDGFNYNSISGDDDDRTYLDSYHLEDDFARVALIFHEKQRYMLDENSRMRFSYAGTHLRLWNGSGSEPRILAGAAPGNLLLPGTPYLLKRLNFGHYPEYGYRATLWIEGLNLGDYSEEELIHIEYDPDANGSWDYKDTVRISGPVPVNLTIDSNNNNVVDGSDDAIENHAPGRIILVDDDGDGNPLYHYEPAPMTLSFGQPIDWGEEFTWELKYPSHVRVYTDQNRTNVVPSGEKSSATPPEEFYVEGLTVSSASGDVIIQANIWRNNEYIIGRDVVRGTVMELITDLGEELYADRHESVILPIFLSPFVDPDIGEDIDGGIIEAGCVSIPPVPAPSPREVFLTFEGGMAAYSFNASNPEAGTVYIVDATFCGSVARRISHIVPGLPAAMAFEDENPPSYSADEISSQQATISLSDQFGNAVEDGTLVSWNLENSTSTFIGVPEIITTGGSALASFQAPYFSDNQTLKVDTLGLSHSLEIPVEPVTGELVLSKEPEPGAYYPTLNIAENETLQISFTNTNVTQGTPVHFFFSNGNIPEQNADVIAGIAIVYINPDRNDENTHVGPCYIVASVAGKTFTKRVDFIWDDPVNPDAPFFAEIDRGQAERRFVLSGDKTTSGEISFAVPSPQVEPLPGFPPEEEFPLTYTDPAPYFTETEVFITGWPGDYEVSLTQLPAFEYLELLDPDTLTPTNQITITQNETASSVIVRSRGIIPSIDPQLLEEFIFENIQLQITPLQGRPSTPGVPVDPWTEEIGVTSSNIYSRIYNACKASEFWGNFTGLAPTDTFRGMIIQTFGGILVINDIGTIIKNVIYFFDEDKQTNFSICETVLSLISIFPGIGDVIGIAGKSALRLFRYLWKEGSPLAFQLFNVIRKAIIAGPCVGKVAMGNMTMNGGCDLLEPFLDLLDYLKFDSEFLILSKSVDNAGDFNALAIAVKKGGQRITAPLKRISAELGDDVARKAEHVFANLNETLHATMQRADNYDDAIFAMGKVLKSGVDPELMTSILKNDLFSSAYKHTDLLVDMSKVSHVKGFDDMAIALSNKGSGRYGNLLELRGAREWQENGYEILEFRKRVDNYEGKTDIDYVLKKDNRTIFVQSKISYTSMTGEVNTNTLYGWLIKAESEYPSFDELWLVVPKNVLIPGPVRDIFMYGINDFRATLGIKLLDLTM